MSDARDTFEAISEMVEENTSEAGIDIVSVLVSLVKALKASGEMTVELWEDFRLSISNSVAIMNNLVEEEIARLKSETP